MKSLKAFLTVFTISLNICIGNAQELSGNVKNQIQQQLSKLRIAHLQSDVELAKAIYHNDLILVSQSGKKYGKKEAVANIKNDFESYETSDITFLKLSNKVVLTNLISERKYATLPKGKYRLSVVWKKVKREWKIISMQSSKVKK